MTRCFRFRSEPATLGRLFLDSAEQPVDRPEQMAFDLPPLDEVMDLFRERPVFQRRVARGGETLLAVCDIADTA